MRKNNMLLALIIAAPFFGSYFGKKELYMALIFTVLNVVFRKRDSYMMKINSYSAAMFFSMIWAVVTFISGTNKYEGLHNIFIWILYLAVYILSSEYFSSSEREKSYLKYYKAVFTLGVVLSVQNFVYMMAESETYEGLYRFDAGVTYANSLAAVLYVSLLAGIYLFCMNHNRLLIVCGGVLTAAAFVLTYSRTMWVIGAFFMPAYIVLVLKIFNKNIKIRYILVVFLCIILIIMLFCIIFPNKITERISEIKLSATELVDRFAYYYDSLGILFKYPVFGLGAGGWASRQTNFQTALYSVRYVHNSILQAAVDGGIIGCLIFVFVTLYPIVKGVCGLGKHMDKIILPLSCNTVLLLHSLFDFDFSIPLVFILYIINSVIILEITGTKALSVKSNRVLCLIVLPFALCLLISEACYESALTDSGNAWKLNAAETLNPCNSDVCYIRGYTENSYEHFVKALKLDDYNPKYYYSLGKYWYTQGDYEKSSEYYTLLVRASPLNAENYTLLYESIMLDSSQDIEVVRELLNEAKSKYSYFTFKVLHKPELDKLNY